MSAAQRFVVTFSDSRRWRTTVEAVSESEAIDFAESHWSDFGIDGEHPFDLLDDRIFDQPEVRLEFAPPPERLWSVVFHRATVYATEVRARTEDQAIGIAQAMQFETDVALFQTSWSDDTDWQAQIEHGGAI